MPTRASQPPLAASDGAGHIGSLLGRLHVADEKGVPLDGMAEIAKLGTVRYGYMMGGKLIFTLDEWRRLHEEMAVAGGTGLA